MRSLFITAFLTVVTVYSYGQFERRTVEMSLAGSFGTTKMTNSRGYSSPEAQTFLFMTASVGYYIIDGLSLGPQIGILSAEDAPPAQSVLFNLAYTKRVGDSRSALFIRGGYGKANAVSLPLYGSAVPIRVDNEWIVNVITAGGGVKFLLSDAALLTVEANYRSEGYTKEDYFYLGYPSYQMQYSTIDVKYENITLMFGFSVLL